MTYIVLARKWRPQNFDEVIGQSHITTTLKNAISGNRVAHAYLFTGPRGIGKTTTARILAKALNCVKGPVVKPCGRCDPCREIASSSSLDVLEIDGASNRGIEEVRNLRDSVKFAPTRGKFKVYIIDEVHMLTTEAFNALLKTLEEPPPHVKFVFATTQPHKVPPTILSRCQRFDFKRIPMKDLLSKLKEIVKVEGLKVTDEALFYIAKASEGSMRDAESILDQLISFCEGEIKLDDVISLLGIVDQEVLFELTQAVIDRDAKKGLGIIDRLMKGGKDDVQFLTNWVDHFRNLMIARVEAKTSELIDLPGEAIDRIFSQGQALSMEEIIYILYLLSNTQVAIKRGMSARVALEVAVVKLAKREEVVSLDEILRKLKELEEATTGIAPSERPATDVDEETGPSPAEKPPAKPTLSEQLAAGTSGEARPHPPGRPQVEPGEREKPLPSNEPAAEEPQKVKSEDLTLGRAKEVWPDVIERIKAEKISAATFLLEGSPVEVIANRVVLGFPPEFSFHKEALEEKENRVLIEKALSQSLARGVKVVFKLIEKAIETPEPSQAKPKGSSIVQSAIEIFDGKIIEEGKE